MKKIIACAFLPLFLMGCSNNLKNKVSTQQNTPVENIQINKNTDIKGKSITQLQEIFGSYEYIPLDVFIEFSKKNRVQILDIRKDKSIQPKDFSLEKAIILDTTTPFFESDIKRIDKQFIYLLYSDTKETTEKTVEILKNENLKEIYIYQI